MKTQLMTSLDRIPIEGKENETHMVVKIDSKVVYVETRFVCEVCQGLNDSRYMLQSIQILNSRSRDLSTYHDQANLSKTLLITFVSE